MLVRAEWKVRAVTRDGSRSQTGPLYSRTACDLAGREALVDIAPHPHTTVLTAIEKTLTFLCSMRT